ncbi:MAG TPA: alkaline phosphatase D family protein [Sporichthyaceae bacterium]
MIDRRSFLRGGLSAGALMVVPGAFTRSVAATLPTDPFTLGVASGEPTADGIVLWTRLAPDPLAEDGLGGLAQHSFAVDWQLAQDAAFRRVVRTGTVHTRAGSAHSVHVELDGLEPARDYWYRFRAGHYHSPVGRTRTAPAPTSLAPLFFASSSCAHWEHGYFTVYRHIADAAPDVIFCLGDYYYEGGPHYRPPLSMVVRTHAGRRCHSLTDYRRRHAQYKTDPDLQAAHAAAPWLVVPDDHEVENNWAGDHAARPQDVPRFLAMRAAAYRAYWEHMPLRRASRPHGSHMQLFRTVNWGALATFHLLDTRQFRDAQACANANGAQPLCAPSSDAARTMLGAAQESWLADRLNASTARWDVLAQQVMFCSITRDFDGQGAMVPPDTVNVDSWDGYPAARDRLLNTVRAANPRNFVVLTGDVHKHWAADIPGLIDGLPMGAELVTSSVSSGGDGEPEPRWIPAAQRRHPNLRYYDGRRGWIAGHLSPERLRADYHVVARVSTPFWPDSVAASFEMADGLPGLRRINASVPSL